MEQKENFMLKGKYKLEIFKALDESARRLAKPQIHGEHADLFSLQDVIEISNIVVNTGGQLALDALIGTAITAFSNANAYIGIGNGTTAPAVGQTDLQGASKLRKAMDATFPSRTGQVMTFRSTFASADANYSWEEIALFNASAAGSMFSRALVSPAFTKVAGLSVVATYTLTCP